MRAHVAKILVVSRDRVFYKAVCESLKPFAGFECRWVLDYAGMTTNLRLGAYALIVIDMPRQGRRESNMIQNLRASGVESAFAPIIAACPESMDERLTAFLEEGDRVFVTKKPLSPIGFVEDVMAALGRSPVSDVAGVNETNVFLRAVEEGLRKGQVERIEAVVERRLEADPEDQMLLCALSMIRLFQGRLDEARASIDKSLLINSRHLRSINLKARILAAQGLFDMAIATLETAQLMSPLNAQRLCDIADLHLEAGRRAVAEKRYRQALIVDPGLESARLGLAKILYDRNQRAEAERVLESVGGRGALVSDMNLRAVMLAKNGRVSDAIRIYEKALGYAGGLASEAVVSYNLALAYARLEDLPNAIEYLRRATRLSPDFEKAASLLKRLERGDGKLRQTNDSITSLTSSQIDFLTRRQASEEVDNGRLRIRGFGIEKKENVITYGK